MNYVQELAEAIRRRVATGDTPEAGPDADVFVLYALLARVKRTAVTASDVHDAWVAWMTLRGEQHESLREFHELPADVRARDEPFADAIRRAAPPPNG